MIRQPLRDQIRAQLRDDLLKGRLRAGEQIRLAPLAERLAVSPTPAREALTQLEAEGWVVLYPNRGFFVAPVTVEEAEALYPVLAGLEGLALELQDPLPAELPNQLRAINGEMAAAAAADDATLAFECDRRWHEALVDSCANPFLLVHLRSVRQRAERYERAYMRDSGRVPGSTEDHAGIIAALEAWPERVPGLLREHWRLSLDFVRTWLALGVEAGDGP